MTEVTRMRRLIFKDIIRNGLDIHSHERTGFLYSHKQRHS